MYEKEIDQLSDQLKKCLRNGQDTLDVPMEKGLSDLLLSENGRSMLWLLCRAGFEPKAGIRCQSGVMKISNLIPCRDPYWIVKNHSEYRQALQEAGRQGLQRFRVLMPREMHNRLTGDGGVLQQSLEKEAGVLSCASRNYPEYGIILYTAFSGSVKPEPPKPATAAPRTAAVPAGTAPHLKDLQEVRRHVRQQAEMLADTIEFYCTDEVWDLLNSGVPDLSGTPIIRLVDLAAAGGIFHSNYTSGKNGNRVILTVEQYNPGFRIARALRLGREAELTEQEKLTLKAARELLAGVTETDPADRVLAISRAIGNRTEYLIDERSEEDDCAFGPLLNGKANCRGYSDAFYLCASLDGFTVSYLSGCSNLQAHRHFGKGDGRHMWNLIRIRDQWVVVDATWDDCVNWDPPSSLYCMVGRDRAEASYRWNHEMYPTIRETTDLERASGIREFRCATRQEVVDVFRAMKKQRMPDFIIFPAARGVLENGNDIREYMQQSGIHHEIKAAQFLEFRCWHILLRRK